MSLNKEKATDTLQYIRENPDKPWNWNYLSKNDIITPEFVESNLDLPWEWRLFVYNKTMTEEFFERHLDKIPQPYLYLAQHKSITPEFIERHIDRDWNWHYASHNPNITDEFVERHLDKPWYFLGLTYNKNISTDFIIRHPDHDWDWNVLTALKKTKLHHILENPEIEWNTKAIAYNPNVSYEDIETYNIVRDPDHYYVRISKDNHGFPDGINMDKIRRNPELQMKYKTVLKFYNVIETAYENEITNFWWSKLSSNPCITPEFIEAHMDYPWQWRWLSQNPNITPEFVDRHLKNNKKFDYVYLSENPGITLEYIEKNIEKKWNWKKVSKNPKLTLEFVERHLDKAWDMSSLSKRNDLTIEFIQRNNHMDWDTTLVTLNLGRKYHVKELTTSKDILLSYKMLHKMDTFRMTRHMHIIEEYYKAHPNRLTKLYQRSISLERCIYSHGRSASDVNWSKRNILILCRLQKRHTDPKRVKLREKHNIQSELESIGVY